MSLLQQVIREDKEAVNSLMFAPFTLRALSIYSVTIRRAKCGKITDKQTFELKKQMFSRRYINLSKTDIIHLNLSQLGRLK